MAAVWGLLERRDSWLAAFMRCWSCEQGLLALLLSPAFLLPGSLYELAGYGIGLSVKSEAACQTPGELRPLPGGCTRGSHVS